jgi:hypothetical protein
MTYKRRLTAAVLSSVFTLACASGAGACASGAGAFASANAPSSPLTASAANAVPDGWKTFSWKAEGTSFIYPATWALDDPLLPPRLQPPDSPSMPLVLLEDQKVSEVSGVSPGVFGVQKFRGSFAVWLEKAPASQVGSDDVASNGGTALATYPMHLPGLGAMTVVEEGYSGTPAGFVTMLALTNSVVRPGRVSSLSQDTFPSSSRGDRVLFAIGFWGEPLSAPLNFDFVSLPRSTFQVMRDFSVALTIMRSIRAVPGPVA